MLCCHAEGQNIFGLKITLLCSSGPEQPPPSVSRLLRVFVVSLLLSICDGGGSLKVQSAKGWLGLDKLQCIFEVWFSGCWLVYALTEWNHFGYGKYF